MKKNTPKSTINRECQTIDRKTFYHRLEETCEMLVGKGYFELFPLHSLKLLYNMRYQPFRLLTENSQTISGDDIRLFKTLMTRNFRLFQLETKTGGQMTCVRFLSEAMLLIHSVQYQVGGKFKGSAALIEAFSHYFIKGDWYEQNKNTILGILSVCALYFYDVKKGMLWVNTGATALVNPWDTNIVKLCRVKLQTCQQEIDGNKRVLVRMCLAHLDIPEPEWMSVKPSVFGFESNDDEPKPLYIQQHALQRFEERTSLPSGLAQVCINQGLVTNTVTFHLRNGRSFVACNSAKGNKIGYFVITYHGDKLIVRTFLFLTNDSTPEGRKLLNLTRLDRVDTEYLKIDRLATFITHDVGKDPELRQLFTAAGCASLMDFTAEYTQLNNLEQKSPDYIHQYLSNLFMFGHNVLPEEEYNR